MLLRCGASTVLLIVPISRSIVALQVWGSYRLIANTFKWLALALLAYVGAAVFARGDPGEVLRGTLWADRMIGVHDRPP